MKYSEVGRHWDTRANEYIMVGKNMLKRGERSDIYLNPVCRLLWSIQLMKATVLAESSCFLSVLWTFYALQQSADMSQVGVTPFSPI